MKLIVALFSAALLVAPQPVPAQPSSSSKRSVESRDRGERGDYAPQGLRVAPRSREGRFNVDVYTDRKSYNIGETVRIHLRSNRDAYVYVFSTDTRGRTSQLFPNYWDQDNYIRAGSSRSIPRGNYDFIAEPPTGRETISVVAVSSRTGIPSRHRTFSRSNPFPSGSGAGIRAVVPRERRHDQMAEASTSILITDRGRRPAPIPPYGW